MRLIAAFMLDVRHAARAMWHAPAFSVAAILTLALAIGANTTIFSVVNAVLIRALPYEQPERIVGVWSSWDGTDKGRISPGEYFDYLRDAKAFDEFGIFGSGSVTLTEPGVDAERLAAGFVTFGVFRALGVIPVAGSLFARTDDEATGDPAVILGESLWRRRFGANPAIVGTRVTIDGRASHILGVLPASFVLPHEFDSAERAQIFVPIGFPPGQSSVRGNHSFLAVGRLRTGVDVAAGSADIARVAASFVSAMPGEYPARQRFSARAIPVQDDINGALRPSLFLLLGAIGCLVLIACTNVASLLLVRGESTRRGTAIRTALGATTLRLALYVLSESLVICSIGGALGVMMAALAINALPSLGLTSMPRLADASIDWAVLTYAVSTTMLVAGFVGLLPVIRVMRTGHAAVPADARTTTGRGVHARQALVGAQVGLTLMLVLGATLLISSFAKLLAVDPGYSTERVLAIDLALPEPAYPDAAGTTAFFVRLLGTLQQQSGVVAAGAVANLPLAAGDGDLNIQIEGRETLRGTPSRRANWQVVTPGYFDAMQMRLRTGRAIGNSDRAGAPGVVVISESMARQYWPDTDPIGARFRLGGGAGPGVVTVVGVVQDIKHNSLAEGPERQMYLAHEQFRFWGGAMSPARSMTVVVRADSAPASLTATIRREVRALDQGVPLGEIRTMDQVRSDSVASRRFLMVLLSGFSFAALTIALVGVYGVVSFAVTQRRREIGVRLAIGGTPQSIIHLMVRQGLAPSMVGIAGGLLGGLALAGALQTLLFEVSPRDPALAIGVASTLAIVTWLACYLPARKAGRTNPAIVLHPE